MKLNELCASLNDEQKAFLLGNDTDDVLRHAFPHKRVVHAGLRGKVVPREESEEVWNKIINTAPTALQEQTVYIHIPFCKTKCLYCGFFQNGTKQEVEDRYVDRLVKEMEMEADSPRLKNGLVSTVFIGGGTPTSLSPANAERVLKTIKKCIPLSNDYELTLEGRVHDLIPEKMDVWMANGVNRMSLGVQSFNTKVRQQLGRLDKQEDVLKNLQALKDYHQCSVVIDLIFGLPDQTPEVWKEDLELLVESGIDGADLYQLNVFDGSDLGKAIAVGRMSPAASTAQQAEMFAFAHRFMTQRAYKRLSNCHWARNNRERSLYNSMAKSGAPMFFYGCGAGGFLNGYSAMNHRGLQPYEAMVDAGKKPFMALLAENELQPVVNNVLTQLESGVLDINKVIAFSEKLEILNELYSFWEKRGLVHFNGYLYELTMPGQFWQVNIAQSTLEIIQTVMTGKTAVSVQAIAAQEKHKEHGTGKHPGAMEKKHSHESMSMGPGH